MRPTHLGRNASRDVRSRDARSSRFSVCLPAQPPEKVLSHLPMDSPVDICAEEGVVILRCGDGCACTFSADAAVIASDRLFAAGLTAKRQAGGTDLEEDWDGP